nr:hypothetical protein [Jeotgalibacillus malaysiensis]
MNHKQWILLITMSTVLLLSIGTITMMLLSDGEITETEPAQLDPGLSETEIGEEDVSEIPEDPQTINSGEETDQHLEDKPDMVNEWFDDLETENNRSDLKESDQSDDSSAEELDNTVVFPTAPEEPEIDFEENN